MHCILRMSQWNIVEAIQAVYPNRHLQCCIVHQIRFSARFTSWKEIKQAAAGLRKIHTSVTLDETEGICSSSQEMEKKDITRKLYTSKKFPLQCKAPRCWLERISIRGAFVMGGSQKTANVSLNRLYSRT